MLVEAIGEEISRVDLAAWFGENGRDLPWRQTRDAWAVLVSEVMLQQTQVARVAQRWPAFLEQYPTPADCAAGPVADVIGLWVGMGFNRRAVSLHRAAQVIVADYDGRVPDTLDELLALPGVGPYTARAVLAFAYERPVAVLDTNVGRILARAAGSRLKPAAAQALADQSLADNDSWIWNQALLDVGATVCRSRSTACEICPLAAVCRWHIAGHSDPDPAVASAAVSTAQSAFEGSDRQGRGRIIDAMRIGPVRLTDVPAAMGWPDDPMRADRIISDLISEGLAQRNGQWLCLPD